MQAEKISNIIIFSWSEISLPEIFFGKVGAENSDIHEITRQNQSKCVHMRNAAFLVLMHYWGQGFISYRKIVFSPTFPPVNIVFSKLFRIYAWQKCFQWDV